MPNSKVLFHELIKSIQLPQDRGETESMAYMILEHELGIKQPDIMAARDVAGFNKETFDNIVHRLNSHEPIQYILGEADFFKRKFVVNPSVLIPRQETELLISETLKRNVPANPKVLDIGTGSGCIAITLALEMANALVTATDISDEALKVAAQNASALKAGITFLHHNILKDAIEENYDVIVSNPPYISTEEKGEMKRNVLDHEPHLALFSEQDPLLFYKSIAAKSAKALNEKGITMVEINEHFGNETLAIFRAAGFSSCVIAKDLQNKDRILIAQIP